MKFLGLLLLLFSGMVNASPTKSEKAIHLELKKSGLEFIAKELTEILPDIENQHIDEFSDNFDGFEFRLSDIKLSLKFGELKLTPIDGKIFGVIEIKDVVMKNARLDAKKRIIFNINVRCKDLDFYIAEKNKIPFKIYSLSRI